MSTQFPFEGFPRELVTFLEELKQNNNRPWFQEHKDEFNRVVISPAQDFVAAMGERLRALSPTVLADPRANGSGSIFRIYRDVRFSKDKTPYKSHLGVFFWDGNRKKMENPGFYFHVEPPKVLLAAGFHQFPKPVFEVYRDSVVHPVHGPALAQAVEQVTSSDAYDLDEPHYKRVPRGYDPDHVYADLLRRRGLGATIEFPIPEEFFAPEFIEYCFERYRDMLPIHKWLLDMMGRAA